MSEPRANPVVGAGLRARYALLVERVETAFEAIRARHAERIQCRAGCSACCRARLAVPRLEAALVREALDTFPTARRATFAARAADPERETCPALDDDGRCGVYDARPLICRSFGVPERRRPPVALINPPRTDVCDLNFTDVTLAALDERDTIDRTALDADLDELDEAYCAGHGLPRRERISLGGVIGGAGDA